MMMKKRIISMGIALTMMTGSALAAVYTDAPGTPTQDQVVSLTAEWKDEAGTAYTLEELPADQLTMDMATDVYGFVYEQENRPVHWYPEETQTAIENMIGGSGDSLYMTELMRLHADDVEVNGDLSAAMTLDIGYQPGQTTVVVLGDTSDSANIVWTPVVSRVTEAGRVEFDIPQELMEQLRGNDLIFTLLTVRTTTKTIVKTVATETEVPETLPSKEASDTTRVVKTVRNGEEVEDDFELVVVQETEVIRREVSLLEQFVTEEKRPALDWLPEDAQNRVRYLLGADADSLIVTDYISLESKYFRPTDGDAVGTLSFATPYKEGQTIVTVLGIPKKDASENGETQMDWIVQPAYVRANGAVDVVFNQTGLIDMDTETGLLLLLSVPETEE